MSLPIFKPKKEGELACPHSSSCPMFSLLRAAGTLRAWQMRYCDADYHACARHQMSTSGREVPRNLLPNGQVLRFQG